jgi:electron transfer flavoprotein beta subunit
MPNSIVLVKQVPDTHNITGQAMKDDGTVNRGALPAIFNPEDLNALEMALEARERFGGTVTVLTMGPPSATEVLRASLYRGADRVVLLTDRKFAGADTLATSYTLCCGVEKVGDAELVFCGRQAIDGDTAQIGPQVAGKLGIAQLTYVEEFLEYGDGGVTVRKAIEGGYEVVSAPTPCLLTVTSSANDPRPPSAKRLLKYRKAASASGIAMALENAGVPGGEIPERVKAESAALAERGFLIEEWNAAALGADLEQCGLKGSPTKVKKIESVIVAATDHVKVEPTEAAVADLMKQLIEDHTLD